ncbi:hypothetical protein [Streptomyces blattellae]|uniref:hypothetical protein n=1 Tax=Streptomyces blattellae TaxID=2569855 RepID=UPI001E501F6A|nr:hypothetical protein [Streptomyces blattellae]
MEQRIGSSSQPLDGAGVDPAFIPGLTSPVSEGPEDVKPEDVRREEAEEPEEPVEEETPEEPVASEEGDEQPDEEAEEAPDGPVFEASDRRARIVADHSGVRLFLDDQECEFRWDEIGAVETESPRFGKRFTITVHTPDRRWFPIEIEATARSRFKEWESELDAVLDAYFDESDGSDEPDGSDESDGSDEPDGV